MSAVAYHLAIEDVPHGQDTLAAVIHECDDWMNDEEPVYPVPTGKAYYAAVKREQRRKTAIHATSVINKLTAQR